MPVQTFYLPFSAHNTLETDRKSSTAATGLFDEPAGGTGGAHSCASLNTVASGEHTWPHVPSSAHASAIREPSQIELPYALAPSAASNLRLRAFRGCVGTTHRSGLQQETRPSAVHAETELRAEGLPAAR